MNHFGLTFDQYKLLDTLVFTPLFSAKCQVWIFGSRATATNQKFSDIDVLYEPSYELELQMIFKIKSDIEDSNFSIKLDLVNINDLADSYREQVLKSRVAVMGT